MPAPAVVVIATKGFSPFHLSVPCIIFGKILQDKHLFDLTICAEKTGVVDSDSGFSLNIKQGLEAVEHADIVVVPFWEHTDVKPGKALLGSLQKAAERGAEIVGLCLGTYVLAWTGLLDGRRAATHWENEQDFKTRFPNVCLDTNALYVQDGQFITSAGTAAGIDCCLHIVRKHYGSAIANRVARRMVMPPHREGGQAQFIERPVQQSTQDSRINMLMDYLRRNLSGRHDLDALARFVSMSRRTLTRQFMKATGMSLGDWLTAERLQRSQELLETTTYSIERVAEESGFHSVTNFRQSFKSRFGVSPVEWRKTFSGSPEQF
ncbi:helix-turn-helix domain-containing protein [Cronobacter sakazakii]|uniref:GlxA family transcriptional regulator n=1 Tax=Cronobacter sakazakii TaxID=28141 RepID=UPI000B4BF1B0|nr:helix-turn-helix domain-containing protein [Cronobacter sakazakii]EJQ2006683.1 helix-turn-helix domain-containing protein [Cronobacter sakazakii]EJQ2087334.1 helix-turn-helix domain-containing protein [Cronobacter sakazakii]EJR9308996.1 helix-turn-helix domain-containing protein [Cronobacter sakazakii]EJR9313679.1 helix-turn-helix domain-containing protein [Cronobacter sakazakii]EJR9318254.1 helix-turn-helix domain-containing protein [Cronobacter sakazakii]